MKRKIIGILALAVLALSVGIYYHYASQPKNIFDEIYQETQKTYRGNNILGQIDNFKIRGSWPSDNKSNKYMPFGKYDSDSLPEDYSEIKVNFNFQNDTQTSSITFEKKNSFKS